MKRFLLPLLILYTLSAVCQPKSVSTVDSLNKKFLNWFNLSPDDDYQGTSVDKAYAELLKNIKPSKKIVVAVIDGGVDIYHPELEGKIWTNSDEVAGNGLDDDNNGYVDDIHGWNFIGGADGQNILYETTEYLRIIKELTPKFGNIASKDQVAAEDLDNYDLYLRCKAEYDKEFAEYSEMRENIEKFEDNIQKPKEILQEYLGRMTFTYDDLKKIKTDNVLVNRAKDYFILRFKSGFTFENLAEYKKHISEELDYKLNMDFDPRLSIVKDNPNDINDRYYGNNDVKGPRSFHGTFVAGIIAANRDNSLGIKGISSSSEIMAIRTVPDGDERDKDVALSIRYAVDNGADIINMSFGKYFSQRSYYMDEALKYADEHNVLVIHSAGNEASNTEVVKSYPSANFTDGSKAKNMIIVGATTYKKGKDFCAVFSNYGQSTVDLFAPGVDIISIFPEGTYAQADGTSFSGPVVTGIAALVWSYYPNLSATQVKEIILKSVDTYPKLKVYVPGKKSTKEKALFSKLSVTGGTVNAYKALVEAGKLQSL